jgi:hypothetical protein
MQYNLLHHTLYIKLRHQLIKNKERYFVFARLRLLDELRYMSDLHQLWQTYYHTGMEYQLWLVSIILLRINCKMYTY